MKIYVSGGAKNGKSSWAVAKAVNLAKEKDLPLYFVATMIARDDEDVERVLRHRKERRGLGFTTIEVGPDISWILDEYGEKGVYLLDSVTALLSNAMFPNVWGAWFNENAADEIIRDLTNFLERAENVILVSDYIYADTRFNKDDETDYTDEFVRGLAKVDKTIAKLCDECIEVSAGMIFKR